MCPPDLPRVAPWTEHYQLQFKCSWFESWPGHIFPQFENYMPNELYINPLITYHNERLFLYSLATKFTKKLFAVHFY